ncbi:PC-esterase domain-containing protein 1A-like [Mytilus galloprovincialis]|uniref:PC-esterase domain-containing protein 1A-like n=1 Tax=Mytilus galloprovincialis TaxID=29158 RepID=UPI003F7BD3CA
MVKTSNTHIFLQEDANKLLHNKFIVIIGDSIQRGIYKDLVLLLQKNKYLRETDLRKKGEFSFIGDQLIEGGQKGVMTNGKNYREIRQYQTDYNLIRFYFVTRCYNTYIESILSDLTEDPKPDVVIMNSCLWDITRYGKASVEMYKENLDKLYQRFKECLPEECLVLWNATLPISKDARGGFIIPEIEFMNSTLRLDILEANFYARQIIFSNGYDFLDLHYYLRGQLQRRVGDGIHWDMTAHRRITNLILTHLAEAWGENAPESVERMLPLLPPPVNRFNHSVVDNLSRRPPVATVSPINFGVSRTLINESCRQRPIRDYNITRSVINNNNASGYQWQPYANDDYNPPNGMNRNRSRLRDQPYHTPFQCVQQPFMFNR